MVTVQETEPRPRALDDEAGVGVGGGRASGRPGLYPVEDEQAASGRTDSLGFVGFFLLLACLLLSVIQSAPFIR